MALLNGRRAADGAAQAMHWDAWARRESAFAATTKKQVTERGWEKLLLGALASSRTA